MKTAPSQQQERPGDREAAQRMSELINRGRFRQALDFGQRHVLVAGYFSNTNNVHAKVYFQLSLAARLKGRVGLADEYWAKAKQSPSYSQTMEGDFKRDLALMHIRQGHLQEAEALLPKIADLHKGDKNRQAVLLMTEARLMYANGYYNTAYDLHQQAHLMWVGLGEGADQQWMLNNDFHWIKAARAASKPAGRIYRRFKRHEVRPSRKARGWAYYHFGPSVAWADRKIEAFKSRPRQTRR